jgi:hypothetical protein
MSLLKAAGWLCFLVFPAALCRADVSQIQILFQSIIAGQDETRLPSGEDLVGPVGENIIRTASADEIQSLLPLGQKCPHSPRLTARGAGLILFLGVSLRLDSAKLLEGYVDDLAALLDDPDQGVRGGAIYILGATNPAPSPKALAHLEAHLNDQISDDDTASTLAASLLKARGASVIPAVLTLLEQRPGLLTGVIQMLGLYRITTDEALKLIHAGFQDSRADSRRVSVDAVANLPMDAGKGFEQDLLRLMQNPDEEPRVSERARQVYLQ